MAAGGRRAGSPEPFPGPRLGAVLLSMPLIHSLLLPLGKCQKRRPCQESQSPITLQGLPIRSVLSALGPEGSRALPQGSSALWSEGRGGGPHGPQPACWQGHRLAQCPAG